MVGAVANSLDPAVMVAGIRSYLKYMPFFLLPLVYPFSDKEMTSQFKFLVALALLQLPLVILQFFVLHWGNDVIGGTFGLGSFMSIFMVSAIVILMAFYFRGFIGGRTFLILAFLLFIPTTLNESKGTFILMVVGFLVIMLVGNLKRSQIIMGVGTLAIMLTCFTVIYNVYFNSVQGTGGLISFFTKDPDKGITNYLYSGESTEVDPDTVLQPRNPVVGALPAFDAEDFSSRRIDEMILPLRALSNDPVKLLLGIGIGNASTSKLQLFAGQYSFLEQYSIFGNAVSRFLWEIGVLGMFLYLLFFWFIYKDARWMARTGGFPGAFALGWTSVIVIVVVSLPYKNIFVSENLSALLWYLSGYVAAKSYALRKASPVQLPEGKSVMTQPSTTHPVGWQSIQNNNR